MAPIHWKGLGRKMLRAVFMCVCVFAAGSLSAEPMRVAISGTPSTNKVDPVYFYEHILEVALEKTRSTDGDYYISHVVHGGGIARDRAMIIADTGIDVMWASATKERMQQMRVVPIDLLKNMNNYRALLIHKDSQGKFSDVKSIEDLKRFSVGSGEHWTDGNILKDNGFNVISTSSYYGLFKMLAAHRFDFISRGLHEIGTDETFHKDLGLIQEKSLLLMYDTPVNYSFFVNINNIKLASRLERGLKLAIADGTFDKLFFENPSFKEGAQLMKSPHRKIIMLKNTKAD